MLDRAMILGASDLPVTPVDVPEWGGQVGIRVMTGTERDAFEQAVVAGRRGDTVDLRGLKVRLVALTLCDAEGARLFSEADVDALSAKSGKALDRVFNASQKANGLTEKDVEDLAGNSEADLNA